MKVEIQTRGGSTRWQVRYYDGAGKRLTASGTVKGTGRMAEAEANEQGAQWIADYRKGDRVDRDRSRLTVAEYLDAWLTEVAADLRPSTLRGYRSNVEKNVKSQIGGVRLRDLGVAHVKRLKATLLSSGGRAGKGLSPQSVKNTLRMLSRALRDAEREGAIGRNPVPLVDMPSTRGGRQMSTWTADEVRHFDEATVDDELGVGYHLGVTCGLRRGEVLGLRWSDVDLDAGTLSVVRSRVAHGYDVTEGPPKSGRGRVIDLGSATVARLRRHKAQQAEAHLAAGLPRPTYVVTRRDGTLPHPHTVAYYFDATVKAAGLPRIRFHDLRHTHATLMLAAGEHPKVVQERLGHSSVSITLDVYSHVTKGMQAAAAARLDEAIFGGQQ
jgi:integrase